MTDWRLVAGDLLGKLYESVQGMEIVDFVNDVLRKHTAAPPPGSRPFVWYPADGSPGSSDTRPDALADAADAVAEAMSKIPNPCCGIPGPCRMYGPGAESGPVCHCGKPSAYQVGLCAPCGAASGWPPAEGTFVEQQNVAAPEARPGSRGCGKKHFGCHCQMCRAALEEDTRLHRAAAPEARDYDPITSPIPAGDHNGPHGPLALDATAAGTSPSWGYCHPAEALDGKPETAPEEPR